MSEVVVPGVGKKPNPLLLCGEAPGATEAARLQPFVGKSGIEQDAYLSRHGLSSRQFYRTNVVKAYTPTNPDPTPTQIRAWTPYLMREVMEVNPRVIVAVGRFAMRWFLGDSASLQACHGIPHRAGAFDPTRRDRAPEGCVVVPVMHPAAGFYNNDARAVISWDYEQAATIVKRVLAGREIQVFGDAFAGHEDYWDMSGREFAQHIDAVISDLCFDVPADAVFGLDTEGSVEHPWSLQLSGGQGLGAVLRFSRTDFSVGVAKLQTAVDAGATIVLHNASTPQGCGWDLQVCSSMGLDLTRARLWDTMYAAYLLRLESQSLKHLAYRWCGMKMEDYKRLISGVGADRQLAYLGEVLAREWPPVEERLELNNDGTAKVKKPKHVHARVAKFLADYGTMMLTPPDEDEEEDDPDKESDTTDFLYKRWKGMDPPQKKLVEAALGPMPTSSLDDIPLDKAVWYAARDADATLRLYHRLSEELRARKLDSLMETGMEVFPIFYEMQQTGMPVSRAAFVSLRDRLLDEMSRLQSRISHRYYQGKPFNPGSDKQFAALVRRRGLETMKKTPTGRMSVGKQSIEHLRTKDPAVGDVIEWREKEHIVSMFCEPTLDLMPEDADITVVRTRIKPTRTTTRRLATFKPNLLAFPKHEKPGGVDYGRQVRSCFVAEPGEVFLESDYCLVPGTRVLRADLLWLPIEKLKKGDKVVAIDEEPSMLNGRRQERRLRTAVVEATKIRTAKCKKITLSNGTAVTASTEHPWLAKEFRNSATSRQVWVKTKDLQIGDKIRRFADPWEPEQTWEAGWLAGILDGEGCLCVSSKGASVLSITQSDGPVLWNAFTALLERDYDFHLPYAKDSPFGGKKKVYQIWTCGMVDTLRILGTLRRVRLLEKAPSVWEGRTMGRRRLNKQSPDSRETFVTVVGLEDVGEQEVVSLQTSTKTFVAEGLFTHNSQIEVRMLAHESRDKILCRLFTEIDPSTGKPRDVHTETAAKMFGVSLQEVTKTQRFFAKRVTFGIAYGVTGSGLATQLRMAGAEGWDEDTCNRLIREWLKLYQGCATYFEQVENEVLRTGIVKDCWGMPRYLPAVWSSDKKAAAEARRQAVNHRIQGGAQGLVQRAMVSLKEPIRDLQQAGVDVKWVLQVHDALLLRVPEEYAEAVQAVVEEGMVEGCGMRLRVPVVVDSHAARSWGEL